MEAKDHGGKQGPVEEHSLPGTNQAGKGPGSGEENNHETGPRGGGSQHQDRLEEHSLPGTNQAGKGPGSTETPTERPVRLRRAARRPR
jgi:hypothetical protein